MVAVEGSPEGPTVIRGNYSFESQRATGGSMGNLWHLRRRILPVYSSFDTDQFEAPDEVESFLKVGTYVDIVRENRPNSEIKKESTEEESDDQETQTDVAYVVYYLSEATVAGQESRVLNMVSRVVLPDYQQHKISTQLTRVILERYRPDILTAETGNPFAYLAHQRSNYIGRSFALDTEFTGEMFAGVKEALGPTLFNNIDDFQYGLCRNNYKIRPGMKRTMFDIEENPEYPGLVIMKEDDNPDAFRIMEEWKKRGMVPGRHDEMRYWLEIDLEKVPTLMVVAEAVATAA